MNVRRFWRAETMLFVAVWLALMLAGRSMFFRDPGTFWHVAVGEEILRSHEAPKADVYSFTRFGQPWIADQWLAECAMAGLYAAGGWDSLLLAAATLLAGVYAWAGARLIHRGLHWLPATLLVALVLLAAAHQFHARPLVVTIVLQGVTFWLLAEVEAERLRPACLWWLVPSFVLWANVHGGVLAGIGTAALALVGWCLADWRSLRLAPPIMVACAAAMLVNPYGLDLPRSWLQTLVMPLPQLIQEHARLGLHDPLGWTVVGLGVGYVVLLLGVLPQRPRVTWLLPLVWLVLSIQRIRNAPLFGITLLVALPDVLPHVRWAGWLTGRGWLAREIPEGEKRSSASAAVVPLLLVAATFTLQVAKVSCPVIGRDWVRLDARYWPVELAPQLEEIGRNNPGGTPIFNDLHFGGFLIHAAPQSRVFIDDRCPLYGSEFLGAYDLARRENPAEVDRWRQQYQFRYALVLRDSPFDRYLTVAPGWTVVGRSPAATLYGHGR